MLPFVVGALIAYAFSPYIDRAQARTGRSRLLIVARGYGAGLLIVGADRPGVLRARLSRDRAADQERAGRADDGTSPGARRGQHHDRRPDADGRGGGRPGWRPRSSRSCRRPEGAIRAVEQILHGTLDVVLTIIVTFYLLLDGGRLGNTALRFLDPADRAQMRQVATPGPRRRRTVAPRPAAAGGAGVGRRLDRARADPRSAVSRSRSASWSGCST